MTFFLIYVQKSFGSAQKSYGSAQNTFGPAQNRFQKDGALVSLQKKKNEILSQICIQEFRIQRGFFF